MFPPVATKRRSSQAATAERKRLTEAEEAAAAVSGRDRAGDDEQPRKIGQARGGKG